ncbi:phenylacetate--CoA ligase family protein [Vibrio ziniensis]|uniref:Phenylacetate--CoA ligase family protein n=1 Tax=Vibrio ziniensis TaxID=2711221 RepID=A0A6G7CLJ4_9VIBR|nr:phenylacetate--CoA ligase family protein [Vibrio ziniensis]QIH42972.1 phenylacetate--CoA ligase family protein [Vibrio ziniensis]
MISLHKIIYNIGVKFRNPSYYMAMEELSKSEFFSLEELQDIQKKKLFDLIEFAKENSAYYLKVLGEIELNSNDNLYDILNSLPTITKRELLDNINEISTVNQFNFKKIFNSETSGTSGEPLVFPRDEEWDSYHRASIARGLSWHGVKPYCKSLYFWGYTNSKKNKFKNKINDILLNRKRLFTFDENSIKNMILNNQDAVMIHGYSSVINEVAKIVVKNDLSLKNLKVVKGTSEKIYDSYNEMAIKAFDRKIISEYGAAEAGIIAFECEHGKMHINEETCILENIAGQAVVTNLHSKSFPIIRYELGDAIILTDEQCDCGRSHKIISEITGRVGKKIYGYNDKEYPSLTLYYIFKNLAIEEDICIDYLAEQFEYGKLIINVSGDLRKDIEDKIRNISFRYFGDNMNINFNENQVLHDMTSKKTDFKSYLR